MEASLYLAFFLLSTQQTICSLYCCDSHVQQDVGFGDPQHKLESVLSELTQIPSPWAAWAVTAECKGSVAGKCEYRFPFVWKVQYQCVLFSRIFSKRKWLNDK